jgi:hypothetical protein
MLLLCNGADIRDYWIALEVALKEGHEGVVTVLLEHGVHVSQE